MVSEVEALGLEDQLVVLVVGDYVEGLLKGGGSGPAIVPGDPDKSLIVTAIRQKTELKMPKNGHLTEPQIQDVATWIKSGAVWPEQAVTSTEAAPVASAAAKVLRSKSPTTAC